MNILLSTERNRAMTLIDLLVVLAAIAILAALILPALAQARARSQLIYCNNYFKQIGLSFRIWEGDHYGNYPMQVPQTNGGTMEFITGPNAFRHFQAASNELSTPYILLCPAESDPARFRATNFSYFGNSNLSYFVGVEANETNPQMIVTGDRNITNGLNVRNGLLQITTNNPAGWTREMHNKIGNISLADGSVQQLSTSGLRHTVANTGLPTNRIQMPILGP